MVISPSPYNCYEFISGPPYELLNKLYLYAAYLQVRVCDTWADLQQQQVELGQTDMLCLQQVQRILSSQIPTYITVILITPQKEAAKTHTQMMNKKRKLIVTLKTAQCQLS